MTMYIECYYADGTQILGNLDGQAALLDVKKYKRTNAYKRLDQIVGNPEWMGGKVAEARVVNEDGRIVEILRRSNGKAMLRSYPSRLLSDMIRKKSKVQKTL